MSDGINFTNGGKSNTYNNNSGNISNNNGSNNNYNGGLNNTFTTINHNQLREEYQAKLIRFQDKPNSFQTYRNKDIKKAWITSWAVFLFTIILSLLGLFSDLITFLSFLNFAPNEIWILLAIFSPLIFLIKSKESRLFGKILEHGKCQDNIYVGDGRLLRIDRKGDCKTYKKIANCSYYDCDGKVYLVNAPPKAKESLQREFIGMCNKSGKDHTYRIDANWIGYPTLFDWGEIEKNSNNKYN